VFLFMVFMFSLNIPFSIIKDNRREEIMERQLMR
jgi:hypothetical protein